MTIWGVKIPPMRLGCKRQTSRISVQHAIAAHRDGWAIICDATTGRVHACRLRSS